MSKQLSLREYVQINTQDHQMLASYGRLLKQLFMAASPQYAAKQIADLRLLLQQKLVEHFTFEERDVFPALLAAANVRPDAAALVGDLKAEHKVLLAKAGQLNGMLADPKLVGDRAGELQKVMVDFLAHLQKHTSLEEELCRTLPVGSP